MDPDARAPGSLTCSVVVPVRDDAAELRGLLACLRRQVEAPLEVIVVDDGSRDVSSPDACAVLARDRGCRLLTGPPRGIAAAAARGYDAARGDLVLRCDADSRPGPGWVAAHRRAHERARPGTVAVTGPGWFTGLPRLLGAPASVLYCGSYTLATAAALGHPPLFGTTFSMRRTWWEDVYAGASRSADVHDDMDLSFRVRPAEHVTWTRAVGVGMSPRALRTGGRARGERAVVTLRRAWGVQAPWERWRERLAVRGAR